jgi:hypothetical protein
MNPDLERNLTRLRRVSKDLRRNTLSDLDKKWLADCLWKIYEGMPPIAVLGLEAGAGQRRAMIEQNHQTNLAMHLVAGLCDKEMGGGMSLTQAIETAARVSGIKPDTLTRYWYDPENVHLRSVFRDQQTYD